MKTIRYQPAAVKTLRKMPKTTSKRIVKKIEAYAENPASQANNIIRLSGRDGIRLRVGDWRVIMKDEQVLHILKIGPRGSVYDE